MQLRELMPAAANSIRNPIEPSHFRGGDERAEPHRRLLEIGAHAGGIDVRLVMTGGPPDFAPPGAEEQRDPDDVRPRDERRSRAERRSIEGRIELPDAGHHPAVGVRRARASLAARTDAPAEDLLGSASTHSLGVLPTVPARPARSPG